MYKNSKFKFITRLILMFIGLGLFFYDKTFAFCFVFTTLLIMAIIDFFAKKRARIQG